MISNAILGPKWFSILFVVHLRLITIAWEISTILKSDLNEGDTISIGFDAKKEKINIKILAKK